MSNVKSLAAKQITKGVVSYLKNHQKLGLLSQVAREANKISRLSSDPNTALVESAIALDEKTVAEIALVLSQKTNREITVVTKVNPSLIAGLKIKLGDQIIDQSFAHSIDQLMV